MMAVAPSGDVIRALVVEDSITVRHALREILGADPELDVIGEACDGAQAIELCRQLRPDVITMDMMLPVLSGLAATEYIMAHFPTPILVVSGSTDRAELFSTYDALAAGAVDVLDKPRSGAADLSWGRRLRAAVKMASRIAVITHPRARLGNATPVAGPAIQPARRLVAIGASTGGPGAVVSLLRALPAAFTLPILLVQHIGQPFGAAYAEWLGEQVRRPTRPAVDRQLLCQLTGQVVIAPPGQHLRVQGGRIRLTLDEERHSCRPSVDVLFESLAQDCGPDVAACLLTGMGRDGAAGLLSLRQAGAHTFAQDEASSVVYGMPHQARLLGAAQEILPPEAIGRRLGQLVTAVRALAGGAW